VRITNFNDGKAAVITAEIGAAVVIPIRCGLFRKDTGHTGELISYVDELYPEQPANVRGRFGK
jgi:hypothetical protein